MLDEKDLMLALKCHWDYAGVNGQFVVPAGGRVKVPSLRVFLSGC